jgi:stage II sporulation protein AA (anti-sigma F factor antagonist)
MELSLQRQDKILAMLVSGKLDSITSCDLENKLHKSINDGERLILLDLSPLDYISSAGLRVLLIIVKRLKSLSGTLVLCEPNKNVQEIFNISGFSQLLKIFPSRSDAIQYLNNL